MGHWEYQKQAIKRKKMNIKKGKIPDFLATCPPQKVMYHIISKFRGKVNEKKVGTLKETSSVF